MGETVLDPFAGHGPTLIAARLEGRRAIGIELVEANAEAAARHLERLGRALGELPFAERPNKAPHSTPRALRPPPHPGQAPLEFA